MTETKASGAKTPAYDPEAQRRLRHATYWAAFIIFITPTIRSGWLELAFDTLVPSFDFGLPLFILFNAYGAFFSLLPLGLFLAWTWPRAEPPGLPQRSLVLFGLLLVYLPIQLFYQPYPNPQSMPETLRQINATLPTIVVIRELDKPALLLLTIWTWWRGRIMGAEERLAYHFLLFLCLIWALCDTIDVGFGRSFLSGP